MMHFREARKGDLSRLFALDQSCFPAEIAYTLDEFQSLLHAPNTVSVVAEEEDLLAGFVLGMKATRGGFQLVHIVTIDVASPFRRRGLGSSLMERLESQLSPEAWLRLEVAATSRGAQSFYIGLGFEMTAVLRNYYPGNLDAFVMEKRLASRSASMG